MPVILRLLSSSVWETLNGTYHFRGRKGALEFYTAKIVFLFYEAVAIVELWRGASLRSDGLLMWSDAVEQLWLQLRAGLESLILSFVGLSASNPEQYSNMENSGLIGNLTLQLREVIKACAANSAPFIPRDWELLLSELMLDLPEDMWGVRTCCNPSCTRLEGPCEVEVKTLACGGGCGARYCCRACQEEAWRDGHRKNCKPMREMMMEASLKDKSEYKDIT